MAVTAPKNVTPEMIPELCSEPSLMAAKLSVTLFCGDEAMLKREQAVPGNESCFAQLLLVWNAARTAS
jgi:hypothetical protein